jgi:hypothetical protein
VLEQKPTFAKDGQFINLGVVQAKMMLRSELWVKKELDSPS